MEREDIRFIQHLFNGIDRAVSDFHCPAERKSRFYRSARAIFATVCPILPADDAEFLTGEPTVDGSGVKTPTLLPLAGFDRLAVFPLSRQF